MSERRTRAAFLFAVVLYTAYFSAYTCLWHQTLKTFAYDLGTVDQGVWLAGHSRNLFVTVRGLHLLGDHVRLFSFVLAPLYYVWDDVRMLLIVQTIAIAAGSVFLYLLARREIGGHNFVVLALCASYLLNPAVQNLNLDHVHPDAFATTFMLASVYFLRSERLVPFWLSVALAMSCKEDVPFIYMTLGVLLLVRGRSRLGLALALVAGAYFLVCAKLILPHFNDIGLFRLRHGYFGGVKAHFTDAAWLLRRLASGQNLKYLLALGLPVGFMSLLSPLWLIPAVPALLANLLSDVHYMRTVEFHYATSIVPFIYVAAIDGARKVLRAAAPGLRAERVAVVALTICAVVANLMFSQIPVSKLGRLFALMHAYRTDPMIHSVYSVLERIPKHAAVSADYSLVPHLTHRERVYMFPNPLRAEYWGIMNKAPHGLEIVDYIVVRGAIIRERGQHLIETVVDGGIFARVAGDEFISLYERTSTMDLSDTAACGDWNGDGKVTEFDARRIAAAITSNRECPPYVCDVNGDGAVTMRDGLAANRRVGNDQYALKCPARQ